MKIVGKDYDFKLSWKKLKYIIFSRKLCPKCGRYMERITVSSGPHSGSVGTSYSRSAFGEGTVTYYIFEYSCNICNQDFTLNELID